jgi:hypothetical protein
MAPPLPKLRPDGPDDPAQTFRGRLDQRAAGTLNCLAALATPTGTLPKAVPFYFSAPKSATRSSAAPKAPERV